MLKFALRALPITLLILSATPVRADDVRSNIVQVGYYFVFYHDTATDLQGPYVPPGVNFKLQNVQTPYLAYLRRFSEHFYGELAFGVPPLTKTYGHGPATLGSVPYNGQEISTARWVAPTALLEYAIGSDDWALRPYFGAGLNYTYFTDRDSTAAGNAASGGPTKITLPPSWGPAATVGLAWRITPAFRAIASYSAARVSSHLTADTAGVMRSSDISFGPQSLVVAVGYVF